jgi:hypothetical protein
LDRRGSGVAFVSERAGDGLSKPESKKCVQWIILSYANRAPCRPSRHGRRAVASQQKPTCGDAAANRGDWRHPAWSGLSVISVAGCDGSKTRTWNSCTRPANGRRNSVKPRPLISTTPHIVLKCGFFKILLNQGENRLTIALLTIVTASRRRCSSWRARSRSSQSACRRGS